LLYLICQDNFFRHPKITFRDPIWGRDPALRHRSIVNSMKTSFTQQQSIVATSSDNHTKQAQCRHVFPSEAHEKLF